MKNKIYTSKSRKYLQAMMMMKEIIIDDIEHLPMTGERINLEYLERRFDKMINESFAFLRSSLKHIQKGA